DHQRVQQRLEPFERLVVGKHDLRDLRAVDLARLVEDPVAEPGGQRLAHSRVVTKQAMDDLVAGDDGRSVACKRGECLALAGSDAAGDGDGDRSRQDQSGEAGGSPSESPGPCSSGATVSASMLASACSGAGSSAWAAGSSAGAAGSSASGAASASSTGGSAGGVSGVGGTS